MYAAASRLEPILITFAGGGGSKPLDAQQAPTRRRDRRGQRHRRRRGGRFLEQGWDVDGWDLRPATKRGSAGRRSTWPISTASPPPHPCSTALDAVVNCAAIATLGTILDIDPDDWSRTLAINLGGSFNVARALYPALRTAGGVLILVGSVNARNTTTRRGAYSASKAAVVSLTQTIAVEWALADSGIRVLCVSPGLTRTAQATMRIESGAIDEKKLLGRVPLNRWITPDEIAAAIVSLTGASSPPCTARTSSSTPATTRGVATSDARPGVRRAA